MKTRLLILMAVLMTMLAVQASDYYGFKIGGVSVNSDNCNNVTGSTISGSVVYDHSSRTVTLTNVTITRTGSNNRAIYNESNPGLTVKLVGTNNLSAADAAPVRFERNTTVIVTAGSTTTITGGSEGGIYITNSSNVAFKGYGTIKITATSKGGIEGNNDNNNLSFQEGINATIKGGGGDLLDIWRVAFAGNSKVTLQATGNSSNSNVKNVDAMAFFDNQCILQPIGAAYSETAESVVLNGVNVYNKDLLISNDYVAIINATNFPDANFRNYVLQLFPKGYITATDVANTTSMDVKYKSISSLTGIAYFTALASLDCSSNTLSTLNVTKNTQLTDLNCCGNNLTSLNLTYNNNLTFLACDNNQISTLSLTYNTALSTLYCNNNKLTTLNLTHNTALTSLYCNNNKLTTLDLSRNTALKTVFCYFNNIDGDGAESFVNNLPQRTSSGTIRFTIANGANETDYNHLLISQAQAARAKKWDVQYTTVSAGNPWLSYDGEIPVNETHFPDDNFREWVSNYDTNGNGYLTPSELNVTSMFAQSKNITSLQGIEYFTELKTLNLNDNSLTSLDLSNNKKLTYLSCTTNQLTTLNVSECTLLQKLYCTSNQLQQLDLTPNKALTILHCNDNKLTSLKVSTESFADGTTINLYCNTNKLSTDAVDQFIASLDNRPTRKTYYLFTRGDDDQKMTVQQVQNSRAKGWWPKRLTTTGILSDYEGESDTLLGDVNGDGSVDVSDVNIVINIMLGKVQASTYPGNADCNGDNNVDVSDVNIIINIMLGKA